MRGKVYFKGWYFKCYTGSKTVAFIPACHAGENKNTASLQIITDDAAYHLPLASLEYTEKPLYIKLKECAFSEKGIIFNHQSPQLKLNGSLRFGDLTPISYDIMGPFASVPFMQCRHSVYSMRHTVNGEIAINGRTFHFDHGIGYIEGDRGRSFPARYVWTQCFFGNNSLMLSVAEIPFLGMRFTGIIGIVLFNGKEYRIATYLGAKAKSICDHTVTVIQNGFELTARLLEKNPRPLFAPVNGTMNRTIHESASCKAYYRFSFNRKPLCEFISDSASFEFEYT